MDVVLHVEFVLPCLIVDNQHGGGYDESIRVGGYSISVDILGVMF